MFNVFWNDNLDSNRNKCITDVATYLRNKSLHYQALLRNFTNGITQYNLDALKLREIYNRAFPRDPRPRNDRASTRIPR
jgi:hypothetical protein